MSTLNDLTYEELCLLLRYRNLDEREQREFEAYLAMLLMMQECSDIAH